MKIKSKEDNYISITCGYEYKELHHCTDVITEFINKILTNEEIRNFYLTILSTCLVGTQQPYLIVANGVGGNAKSSLHQLLMAGIGEYGYRMPSNCLLSEIKEGPNPELANIHLKRGIVSAEPKNTKHICTSAIKELTGNRQLPVRNHYQNTVGISNTGTFILECNTKPKLDQVDEAVNRRIITIPFRSRFVTESVLEKNDKVNYFLANPYYVSDQFYEDHKQSIVMILIPYFMEFYKNGEILPKVPEECARITREYLATSDSLFDWFQDNFKECENNIISLKEIYLVFTNSEYYQNMNKKDKRENNMKNFKKQIDENLFLSEYIKVRNQHFNGIKLSSDSIVNWKINEIDDSEIDNNE